MKFFTEINMPNSSNRAILDYDIDNIDTSTLTFHSPKIPGGRDLSIKIHNAHLTSLLDGNPIICEYCGKNCAVLTINKYDESILVTAEPNNKDLWFKIKNAQDIIYRLSCFNVLYRHIKHIHNNFRI